MESSSRQKVVPLSWKRLDWEQKVYGASGRFTRVNSFRSSVIAVLLAVLFYCVLIPFPGFRFTEMFTQRGVIPYTIVFLTSWALVILFIKSRKLRLQRMALLEQFRVVPNEHDFVLAVGNVQMVMDKIAETVDDPRNFVLVNRIHLALSNLRNLGRIGDVDDKLRSQADHDESSMETSYAVISSFVWAIPVLGFIGTVLGLSSAIGEFGGVLEGAGAIEEIKAALQDVTGGLATAFETTLEALVAALGIQLILAFLKKSEEEFLDECTEYCVRNVVNRLRITMYEKDAESV
ncbi:MAG: MotA/TolQ/ExbB proton channel family protein [Planctomycetaceae bacterium]